MENCCQVFISSPNYEVCKRSQDQSDGGLCLASKTYSTWQSPNIISRLIAVTSLWANAVSMRTGYYTCHYLYARKHAPNTLKTKMFTRTNYFKFLTHSSPSLDWDHGRVQPQIKQFSATFQIRHRKSQSRHGEEKWEAWKYTRIQFAGRIRRTNSSALRCQTVRVTATLSHRAFRALGTTFGC